MINVATLWTQTERLQVALAQRRLWPANDNEPPDLPPAMSQRMPRADWTIVRAVGMAARRALP